MPSYPARAFGLALRTAPSSPYCYRAHHFPVSCRIILWNDASCFFNIAPSKPRALRYAAAVPRVWGRQVQRPATVSASQYAIVCYTLLARRAGRAQLRTRCGRPGSQSVRSQATPFPSRSAQRELSLTPPGMTSCDLSFGARGSVKGCQGSHLGAASFAATSLWQAASQHNGYGHLAPSGRCCMFLTFHKPVSNRLAGARTLRRPMLWGACGALATTGCRALRCTPSFRRRRTCRDGKTLSCRPSPTILATSGSW